MKKVIASLLVIGIVNVLPLIGKPELMLNYKFFIVILEGLLLWMTQPKLNVNEAVNHKSTDKFSVFFILLSSTVSVMIAEIEWSYFQNPLQSNNLLTIVGVLLIVGGVALRIWSIVSLGKHFTTTVTVHTEHQLIESGPYSIIRHPSYTGAFLAISGVSFLLNSVYSIFITIFLMLLAYYIRIESEEKLLKDYFGEKYSIYARNKKRLFPYVW